MSMLFTALLFPVILIVAIVAFFTYSKRAYDIAFGILFVYVLLVGCTEVISLPSVRGALNQTVLFDSSATFYNLLVAEFTLLLLSVMSYFYPSIGMKKYIPLYRGYDRPC